MTAAPDPAVPVIAELQAPAGWRSVDFISDLHLQDSEPATFEAWRRYLCAPGADAIFILGDLFEVWIGDDALTETDGFEARCARVLQAAAQLRPVFYLHGNRDFLLGPAFAEQAGITLLADPTLLAFGGHRWLLTHGDALCLDDKDYMAFRAKSRQKPWQDAFLAHPLAERRGVARGLRADSEAYKRNAVSFADADPEATQAWMDAARADVLIHGHTHRPADHRLAGDRLRVVLSDWDLTANPPRAEVLRVDAAGRRERLAPAQG